jgi:hypothetical protein
MKKVLMSKAVPQAAMDILAGKVDPVVLPDSSVETSKRLAGMLRVSSYEPISR